MYKVAYSIVVVFFIAFTSHASGNQVLIDMFQKSFNDSINTYINEYSLITGFYTTGGDVKGAASIGNFPSFRVGATAGIIFMNNPVNFIKKIHFSKTDWNSLQNESSLSEAAKYLNWFDQYFLPLPVNVYNFEIGLFNGFSIGGRFHVLPAGAFARTNEDAKKNIYEILTWGLGANFSYTILKEYNYFPSISVGAGVNYSDVFIWLDNMSVGNVYLDSTNPDIPATIGFKTHHYTTSFFFDFSISKSIKFFQPFASMKFVQTVNHNITKINVNLDMSKATSSAQTLYGDGKFTASNVVSTDDYGNETGSIVPVSDFVLSAGFEFIITIFRFGFESSVGLVSQKGMLTLSMRFQVEKADFEKLKK